MSLAHYIGHAGMGLVARRGGGRRPDVPTRAWDEDERRHDEIFRGGLTGEHRGGPGAENGRGGLNRSGPGAENAYGLVMGPGQYKGNRDGLRLDQSGPNKKILPRDYSQSNKTGRAALVNTEPTLTQPMVDSPNLLFEGPSTLSDSESEKWINLEFETTEASVEPPVQSAEPPVQSTIHTQDPPSLTVPEDQTPSENIPEKEGWECALNSVKNDVRKREKERGGCGRKWDPLMFLKLLRMSDQVWCFLLNISNQVLECEFCSLRNLNYWLSFRWCRMHNLSFLLSVEFQICFVVKTFAISGCLYKLLGAVQETREARSSNQIPKAGKSRDFKTQNVERMTKESQLIGLLHRAEMA
ncbi:hypothetical protein SADUNF_Sadunf10G0009000 [Salix dunnii]|uniref:Uncharacterized protein n=1 Tax=Salix dunnii TaxID=1413687 RepID=A0A835JL88_9ROSI|nr:hypothetical protein SADUNF_Sadunf10G0009000 [Salix dunnii]